MKIAVSGVNLPEGKTKCVDPVVETLTEKFQPAKVSPYYFEFLPDAYAESDAIVIHRERILDLLIPDMEMIENRMDRCESPDERALLQRAQAHLEDSLPLCDMSLNGERAMLLELGPWSLKPTIVMDETDADPSTVGRSAMQKARKMFFYTAGKQEVHAWFTGEGADAVTCAGRIHSDLARGFIKAELVSFEDLMTAHSMEDARRKGLTRLVDRDEVVPPETVLEIRFNV